MLILTALFENISWYRVFFKLGLSLKIQSTKKLIYAGLGVSRTIYVNVDSPNLGFPYFNILGEAQCKKHPLLGIGRGAM